MPLCPLGCVREKKDCFKIKQFHKTVFHYGVDLHLHFSLSEPHSFHQPRSLFKRLVSKHLRVVDTHLRALHTQHACEF